MMSLRYLSTSRTIRLSAAPMVTPLHLFVKTQHFTMNRFCTAQKRPNAGRRLWRSCEYLEVDPTVIRLVWVVVTFISMVPALLGIFWHGSLYRRRHFRCSLGSGKIRRKLTELPIRSFLLSVVRGWGTHRVVSPWSLYAGAGACHSFCQLRQVIRLFVQAGWLLSAPGLRKYASKGRRGSSA